MILLDRGDVVALDKPAGVSMATSSRDGSGAEAVRRLLEACGEPDDPELLLVHRLDVGTSGVVLLARGEPAHRALSLAFQNRRAHKTYRALVWGRPAPPQGVFDDPLGRDPKDGRRMKVRADGKPARYQYRTLRACPRSSDLELRRRPAARIRSAFTCPRTATRSSATTSTAARRAGAACGIRPIAA